jgi:hypothetical protein
MGNTISTYMSAGSDWDGRDAGDGLCVFFYDGSSEFYPGGIGSSLPFALIKYLDENFNGKSNFNTENASINIKKPDWIKS